MFALVIGIDNYAELPGYQHLEGAVADANAFEEYTKTKFSAVGIKLLNQEATRIGILNAFEELARNEHIRWNEAIVFYFAGHGTSLPRPKGWESEGWDDNIQAIVPYDCGPKSKVQPIPDRTIGAYLWKIACAKGNNIVYLAPCLIVYLPHQHYVIFRP